MELKDIFRLIFAKLLFKETILFSKKDRWEANIKAQLNNHILFFYDFSNINLNLFDIIIPLTLNAQKYINSHPKLLKQNKMIIPSDFCIDLCDDKEEFYKYLLKNNLEEFAPRTNQKFSYPYILKKKIGQWGQGISIIKNSQDELTNIDNIKSKDYFTQEYIEGHNDYSAHIIIVNNKIIFYRGLNFIFSERFFIRGKDFKHIDNEEVCHTDFLPIFENILIKMGYEGICCFGYKIVDNKPKIFEINPRYGASMIHFLNDALISYKNAIVINN